MEMSILSATARVITFVRKAELSALLVHPLRHAHHLPQHALRVGAAPHPRLQHEHLSPPFAALREQAIPLKMQTHRTGNFHLCTQ